MPFPQAVAPGWLPRSRAGSGWRHSSFVVIMTRSGSTAKWTIARRPRMASPGSRTPHRLPNLNGEPRIALVHEDNPENPRALEDTRELLGDPKAPAEIERARLEIARGEGVRAEDLPATYLHTT